MAIVTGDRYLEKLVKFVEDQAGPLLDGTLVLKLNPAGLHYVQSRLEALHELENLLSGAPVDYLRAYVSDLGDHRALEQLRRILRLLTSLKVFSVLHPPVRDPTPLSLLPFGRLKVLELRGCDLSTSAAKGLLELRHTLEKIICHNSTNALRHIFASRIAEIKDSPQWNRLSFVSCACNRLVLMDESLQLLPAVETLDLSRNKFAKVDNLRKCVKLKHLDLGFNHLRSIAPFSEVSCHIVQMVLRNNALTTLHGLENLKSLEAIDVSYNIISNFSELEFLISLPSLQSLWLEGNPLCCARWYRPHVFSYFGHPDALKLDDKEISTREFWKRQIIIASRQKRPSSFGFYYPAKNEAKGEEGINRKRRKVSRVASIESKEDSMCVVSDEESPSCDNEIQSKEEHSISDDEAEVNDLMNRVELLKKERSILWLREFKEWLDHASEHILDGNTCDGAIAYHTKENDLKHHTSDKHLGESSKYALDPPQTSGDETNTIVVESDNSFIDVSTGSYGGVALPGMGRMNQKQNYQKSYSHEGLSSVPVLPKCPHLDGFTIVEDRNMAENGSLSSLAAIDDITESHSSSIYPGSPPHYQEDILHRRQNLVEEILQLSAESFSMISSDSHTCSSEDYFYDTHLVDEADQYKNEKRLNMRAEGDSSSNCQDNIGILFGRENDGCLVGSYFKQNSWTPEIVNSNNKWCSDVSHDKITHFVNLEDEWLEKEINQRKPRKRIISLFEHGFDKPRTSNISNGIMDMSIREVDDQYKRNIDESHFDAVFDKKRLQADSSKAPLVTNVGKICDDFVERYFNAHVADCRVNETCKSYMRCDCVLEPESLYREREVVLLLSSEDKLYVLLIGVAFKGSDSVLSLLGWHKIEDTREVLLGFGLQIVRVYIERGATYLFLTRSVEKSRKLLSTLQLLDPHVRNDKCRLSSLELVQVALFEKQICGGSKMSIFQYSLVLFLHNGNEEESWLPRSLFVSAEHLLVCVEDLKQFSCPSKDASSPPYFSLDSCCTIGDVYELVIEAKASQCVTLALERAATKFSPSSKAKETTTIGKGHIASGSMRWKLKWFSEESLSNFVALVKAIHAGLAGSPLRVTCVS